MSRIACTEKSLLRFNSMKAQVAEQVVGHYLTHDEFIEWLDKKLSAYIQKPMEEGEHGRDN